VAATGKLEISNRGKAGDGPLYLDRMTVRPAALVSLAEALDWPGAVEAETGEPGGPGAVFGAAEAWLAPDGADAVCLSQPTAVLRVAVPGPGLLSFRSRNLQGL
jgi:hypothetical protein